MTLDEAIERYTRNAEYERTHGNLQGCLEFRQFVEWLKELKQLREQTRWIPVSERLPKVMDGTNGECSDDVLICVADDEMITISTGFYGYYPKSKSSQGWWSMWAYGCRQIDSKYKVVAWMPLLEPYKAESEEV